MTPTHAVKKGTRYRYYVSRRLIWFEGLVALPPLEPVLLEMALHGSPQIFIDDRRVLSRRGFALVDDLAP